jgi:hypothetical protein
MSSGRPDGSQNAPSSRQPRRGNGRTHNLPLFCEAPRRAARVADLEAIGRGLGSVQIGTTGAAELLRSSAPDWRRKQAGILRDLLEQFLERPNGELYSGLAVGLHALLLGVKLSESLERRDA